MPAPPVLVATRAGLRRYLRELRASQTFLAGEVSHPGWLNLGQFRWRNVAPGRAARAAAGVLVPLTIGFGTGHVEYGTFAALGALPAGMVSFQGVTRSRVLLVAIAAAGMAVSTFVGATTSASAPWLLVPVIMAWSYVAGSCAVLGPAAIVVSLQWPVAVLIASAIPLPAGQAAIRAGLVLAGGLWQGALVVSSWAVSRGSAERAAMAESYRALSDYASRLAAGDGGPPPPDRLPGSIALRDPNPLMRTAARRHLVDLMEEAERLRTTLTALGSRVGVDQGGSRRALLAASGNALHEVAKALSARPARRHEPLDWARQILADDLAAQSWGWAGEALHGQLRSAIRMTERLNDAEPVRFGLPARRTAPGSGGPPPTGPAGTGPATTGPALTMRLPAHDLLVTLWAGQGISSETGRHALRVAAVVGLTEAIALAAGLPHGYWAALTALIVLRPDYGSTLYRGLQRAVGTALGAGLGVATVLLGHFGDWALLTGFGVCLLAAYAVLTVNYLLFAIFLTDFVVVLLALLGLPADQTAVDRLIGTCVGAGLALLAYLLWPTWERTTASEKFARLFLAQGSLAGLQLRSYTRPASDEARQARHAKVIARRARVDAEAAADRLADEPDRPPVTREFALGLVSAGHRLALAGLAVEAAVRAQRVAPRPASPKAASPRPDAPQGAVQEPPDRGATSRPDTNEPDSLQRQLDRLADAVRQASVQLAEALHRMRPPGPLPPLRELQVSIHREHGARGDSAALLTATDSQVDALNTAADIIRRQLGHRDDEKPG